jgi:hypothetical protein
MNPILSKQRRLELMGKKVRFDFFLSRTKKFNPDHSYETLCVNNYTPLLAPVAGWISGFRTIADGVSSWIGEEEGWSWYPAGHVHHIVLITTWPFQNPVRVHPRHITLGWTKRIQPKPGAIDRKRYYSTGEVNP